MNKTMVFLFATIFFLVIARKTIKKNIWGDKEGNCYILFCSWSFSEEDT